MKNSKGIIIFSNEKYFDIPLKECELLDFNIRINESNVFVNDIKIFKNKITLIDDFNFLYYSYNINDIMFYEFKNNQVLVFGNNIFDMFTCQKNKFHIKNNKLVNKEGTIFVNGKKIEKQTVLKNGDLLFFDGKIINYKFGSLEVIGNLKSKLFPVPNLVEELKNFPDFHKSPRIIKTPPIDKVEIKSPPSKEEKQKKKLIAIIAPPLIMSSITIGMRFFIGSNSPFVLIMIATSIMTTIFAAYNFFDSKKRNRIKNEIRKESYLNYLIEKRTELFENKQNQIESIDYMSPPIREIEKLVLNKSHRIYERDYKDDDFLDFIVGYTDIELSFDINYNIEEIKLEDDELKKEMENIVDQYKVLKNQPIQVNIKNSHLGIVGRKKYIKKQICSYVMDICTFNSYHDVEIIFLPSAINLKDYEWMKWLKHFKFNEINLSTFIGHDNQREQVLSILNQKLKHRKKAIDEKKEISFFPHYIVIIDEPNMLINNPINEYLLSSDKLGFSLVYVTDQQANLPSNISTIINVEDADKVRLLMNENEFINKIIDSNDTKNVNFELFSRSLAAINHIKGVTSSVPEKVGFLEMFNVTDVVDLEILEKWKNNSPERTLETPLGYRAKNELVNLNLHEKAHGPHGLVAGTTGSGKSEILQSYILSLSVNFSPEDVGFLLIDFKGGGMAELFKNLPHLMGSITNLDGSESHRALISINSELKRRQTLFKNNNVNNINSYTKKYKKQEIKEPLPHLFIICDEFAELKKQQPEFMDELISTARIGRSLGVHLILATQKPSGVVNDQIWSNSKFKLALKVQNESDSNEILKTKDAAAITIPGRAYLQVGNNEIYELFQSAFSGKKYSTKEEKISYDDRIYKINEIGQGELINNNLFMEEESDVEVDELEAVVNLISSFSDKVPPIKKPWEAPLEKKIFLEGADDTKNLLDVKLGIIDIPTEQTKEVLHHDFSNVGNLLLYGASGYGKTNALKIILLELIRKNCNDTLLLDILDFGNSNLLPFKNVKITRNYITFDDEELLRKWTNNIMNEVVERKQLFAKNSVSSIESYNQKNSEKLNSILIVIDNVEIANEIPKIDINEIIAKIARDGKNVGINIVITTNGTKGLRFSVTNYFKRKISLYQYEKNEYNGIVGRVKFNLPDVKGRGFINNANVDTLQFYLPFDAKDEIEEFTLLEEEIKKVNEKNVFDKATGIKMLNDLVKEEEIIDGSGNVNIGLNVDTVEKEKLCFDEDVLTIIGAKKTGKSNVLKLIMNQINEQIIYLIDLEKEFTYLNKVNIKFFTEMNELIGKFQMILDKEIEIMENSNLQKREYLNNLEFKYIIIDNINFEEKNELAEILVGLQEFNYKLIVTAIPNEIGLSGKYNVLIKQKQNLLILGNPSEQKLISISRYSGKIGLNFGLYCVNDELINIQVPFAKEEE